ncbi:MAG: AMP-binding protein [Parasphingopyxis sp.]|uniref:AMP-binding protein n=1 Tax=Parasphingopyxis sp. TaxID=1920299 RepID=UPI003FA0E187
MQVSDAPFRHVDFPPVDLDIERRDDGTIVMTPAQPLEIGVPNVPTGLARQAAATPGKPHLRERDPDSGDWRTATFGDVKRAADGLTQWLIDRDLAGGGAMLIVSGNSIAHAVIRYGSMGAGVPVTPVSEAYALLGAKGDYQRLRHVVATVQPTVAFGETAAHVAALRAVLPEGVPVISREPDADGADYAAVTGTAPTDAVAASIDALTADTVGAYMLTSGSTGRSKAVIQTHGMIVANLFQGWQALGKAAGWDDVLLEWLPWSHVSGAFSSMAAAIFGGTFHIDEGKPVPGLFDATIRNLRDVELTYFTNVPAGYAMLVDALERDRDLAETFFRKLRLVLYGGAGLPQPVYDRLQRLAVDTVGHRIMLTTGYGATETTSGAMSIYFESDRVGIGLPMPGLSVKMVPIGDRYELRMKGPMVTPGYLGEDELNANIRDEEGFYKIGDTARFHDPDAPEKGLAFAGRLAEEFKLATGTWVSAGNMRMDLLRHLAPLVGDLLVCGENRDYVGILAWPSEAGLRSVAADPQAPLEQLLCDDGVLAAVREGLAAHNQAASGSSGRVVRFAFLADQPNAEAHEISDKGTVNQALAKHNRPEAIEALYADAPGAAVISMTGE